MKKSTTSFKANEDTRIWCEYCRIFVYNNRINREKHDNSPQHQANFKKKVETIRREEEEKKKLQNVLETKPTASKSFYNDSKALQTTQSQPLNILNLKSSLKSLKKKPILGLSTVKNKTVQKTILPSDDPLPSENRTVFDIKSVSSELKRKMMDDEKLVSVSEPEKTENVTEDIDSESLSMSMFKKKRSK